MPTVTLAPAIARWLTPTPGPSGGSRSVAVTGTTLREALNQLFAEFPNIRDYVLDESGALRHHVVAFVDGTATSDKQLLHDPLTAEAEIYLFQALSGG